MIRQIGEVWINGGFFVVEPEVLDLIDGDETVWEQEPMQRLVTQDQLAVYRHEGYWQNMDTLRDKAVLQELWDKGDPPWRVWDATRAPGSAARESINSQQVVANS